MHFKVYNQINSKREVFTSLLSHNIIIMNQYNFEQEVSILYNQYKSLFPDWPDDVIRKQAEDRATKYSTVKQGNNVIHLEYYSAFLDDSDIIEIEKNLEEAELELSRFDRLGVPFASIHDFTLDLFLFICNPIVQNILLGVGSSVVWDSIKASTLIVWKRFIRKQQDIGDIGMNCGMEIQIDEHTNIQLKFEGNGADEEMQEALDKILNLIHSIKTTEVNRNNNFFIYDKDLKNWKALDRMKEMAKIAQAKKKAR